MIAGYAWPWISKNDKSLNDIEIEGRERMWNNKTENWVHCDTASKEELLEYIKKILCSNDKRN